MKTKYTHELRYHDYRKGANHVTVLDAGSEDECVAALRVICEKERISVNFATTNKGYKIVDLEAERIRKIQLAGPTLLEILQNIKEYAEVTDLPKSVKSFLIGETNEGIKKATT